jgi:hypothetical protein
MPAWVNVLVTIAMVLGGIVLQALFISYTVGNAVGKYRERLEAGEAANLRADFMRDKMFEKLEIKVDSLMQKVSFLEGRFNARERGGND